MKKLTQKQLDAISDAATNVKNAMEELRDRLNGNGIYVGEMNADVFASCDRMTNAPRRQFLQLRKALQEVENQAQMAEFYAEEMERWADDAEATK